jgi:hypothetical protein
MKGLGLRISPYCGLRGWTALVLLQVLVVLPSPHPPLPPSGHCFHALPRNLACRTGRSAKSSTRGKRYIMPLECGHPERMLTISRTCKVRGKTADQVNSLIDLF